MMVVGSMRFRITLQKFTVTRGDGGGEVKTWTDAFTAFAAIEFKTIGSDERYSEKQLHSRNTTVVTNGRKHGRAKSLYRAFTLAHCFCHGIESS